MASELFLGPDGGPYVSVNENSGDIELKDNSGNVVAFWDESNTQWDLNSNDIQNVGSLSAEGLGTKKQSEKVLYAAEFDGSDADARLDNALASASRGDEIRLEGATYSDNRTITTRLIFIGYGYIGETTDITGDWTLDGRMMLQRITNNGTMTFNEDLSGMSICQNGNVVQINADDFRYINNFGFGSGVTFANGTSGGIVDGCSGTTVTDNGSNTVGDIA